MAKLEGRTVREFPADQSIWNVIDTWALQNSYKIVQADETGRVYQKGMGFLLAPSMFKASPTANGIRLEAWVRVNLFTRISSLFIFPPEIIIDSGGFKAVVPRNKAREEVNLLLQSLGQPPIQ